MSKTDSVALADVMAGIEARYPNAPAFHQAVSEVLHDVLPVVNASKAYRDAAILTRLTVPDRVISFRVDWMDDAGVVQTNLGHRVQFNNAIGPYKGGLRFHPSVTPDILQFLGFEQTLKNALTGLPMGGAKGGSDFNPKGRSRNEIMRFCQSFMMELYRHIGPDTDVPAGDINVGGREIGFMFGTYRKIMNTYNGVITGKGLAIGGSQMRTESTGYGLVQFLGHMLATQFEQIDGQTVVVSGAGNVATHAAELAMEMGGKVVTLSDSTGFLYDADGLNDEKLAWIRDTKSSGGKLAGYADTFGGTWNEGKKPWGVQCDIALPCATQNEMNEESAKGLIKNGCKAIAEGANMPLTGRAVDAVRASDVLFGPAKAANAGGVAVSGLELSQNQMRRSSPRDELADSLHKIMKNIHDICAEAGATPGGQKPDYAKGANIAGFRKVADAMLAQGVN
jgi:glutamate dehydrogenase (NADP+)